MRLSSRYLWGLLFLLAGCASLGPLSPLVPVERALVYQPRPFPESDSLPENLPFEDAWFEAEDGTRLHGWYLGHPKPRAVALFCHGNTGNIVSRSETLKILQERHGLAVMTFDYRGYGKSEGKPSERGILQDARAARAWLASRAGVEETEIVLMGRSLGGAVAVDLAAEDGARGLVLASTFSSLPDAAAYHVPWILPSLNMTQRLNSAGKIGNYSGPLLQSHGDKDQLIPIELGRKLFDAAGEPKQFVVIPGAGHNDPQPEEYRRVFDEFIASLPRSDSH
ncbi:MAG: alpha/beta hydrolase [Planctomycetaceae bacterium]|nr:alpha/beta hydrolase [Planctomycetaceae bacterium]